MSIRTLATVFTALTLASCDEMPTAPAIPEAEAPSAAVVGGLSQLKNHLVWTDGYVDSEFNEVIWITDPDGQNVRTLTYGTSPAVHPDGRQIAFIRRKADGTRQAYVMPTQGGVPFPLAPNAASLTWSPDGSHIVYYDRTARGYAVINAIGSWGHGLNSRGKFVEWSADGTQLYFHDYEAAEIVKYTLGGAVAARTTLDPRADFIDISPDESKVLYNAWDNLPEWGIWTVNMDGSNAQRLARGWRPRWSPDGTKIAWTRERLDGSHELRVIDRNGRGKVTLARETGYSFEWSRNGRRVFIDKRPGVLAVKVDASQVSVLVEGSHHIPVQRPPEPVEPGPLPLATPTCVASP
jgi:Tol biopolymer transport system component